MLETSNKTAKNRHNGHEYVEIGGIKWATCNVGAEKPTDNGLYFAWGETKGFTAEQVKNGKRCFNWRSYKYGSQVPFIKYNATDGKAVLDLEDDAAHINMGGSWRMPKEVEFRLLRDSTTSKWVTNYQDSSASGMLFTDKKDNTKTLFFPAVGLCIHDSFFNVGSSGFYWSTSLGTSSVIYGCILSFLSDFCDMRGYNRDYGFAVRGVVAE